MGLSSFNRMRREKAPVETIEAERFKLDNEARQNRRLDRDAVHEQNAERNEEAMEAELAAAQRIGEKVEEGMKPGVLDEPLRRDHAAEIAGRNIEGVQTPKDPVDRVSERTPQAGTANEKLVPHTPVERKGPTKAQNDAAAKEVGSLPAPATADENVAPKGETVEGNGAGDAEAEAEGSTDAVDIPADWEGSHWRTRVALAEKISGRDDVKTEEANDIIKAEQAARAQ